MYAYYKVQRYRRVGETVVLSFTRPNRSDQYFLSKNDGFARLEPSNVQESSIQQRVTGKSVTNRVAYFFVCLASREQKIRLAQNGLYTVLDAGRIINFIAQWAIYWQYSSGKLKNMPYHGGNMPIVCKL